MNQKYLELARKLNELAKRGEGGERTNADMMLRKIMNQYGFTISNIEGEQMYENYYKVIKEDQEIFVGVVESILGDSSTIFKVNGKSELIVKATAAQAVEIEYKFDFFRKAYKREIEAFQLAFIVKNNLLHIDRERSNSKSNLSQESMKRVNLARKLMNGMNEQDYNYKKMIDAKNNEVVVYDANKLISTLPQAESKLILAAIQPKIREIKPLKAATEINAIISTIYTIAGQQTDVVTQSLFADEFYTTVLEKYPFITLEEIRTALRNGVYDEYGEYYGLNPKTFLKFVKSYITSQERKEAKKLFDQKRMEISEPKLTDEQIINNRKDFVNTLYQWFLNGNLFSAQIPAFFYDFLERENMIDLSPRSIKTIKAKAKKYAQMLDNSNKQSEKMRVSEDLFKPKSLASFIIYTAEQFAVFDYFELCKLFKAETIFPEINQLKDEKEIEGKESQHAI